MNKANTGCAMLIDDCKVDNFINGKILEMTRQYQHVLTFENAVSALDFLQTGNRIPDVIFLDLYMPDMNGYDFIDEFAKLSDTVKNKSKIVLLSASCEPHEVAQAKNSQYVVEFLVKPLTTDVVHTLA